MRRHHRPVRLLLSDVDGTLVTSDKTLTSATIAAAGRLREAGVRVAVTSGRPPRGMGMLVEPLSIDLPLGGPTVTGSFLDAPGGSYDGVAKVTGVSDDPARISAALDSLRAAVGDHVATSCSRTYYLDVTDPDANKGAMARWLADRLDLAPEQIATIDDMSNDVLMFAHSGMGIAMGNATAEVQRAARHVTRTNDADGRAHAVDRFVLPAAGA